MAQLVKYCYVSMRTRNVKPRHPQKRLGVVVCICKKLSAAVCIYKNLDVAMCN